MKRSALFPTLTLVGSAVALGLRLAQNRTGFEAETGLPIQGNPFGCLLPAVLILLGVLLVLLARRLPEPAAEDAPPLTFANAFSTGNAGLLTLPVMGVLLMGASGGLEIGSALLGDSVLSPQATLFQGMLSLASALCLLPMVAACRQGGREDGRTPSPRYEALLVPVVCLVVRLVLTYRVDSVNPSLSVYYVELLALVFLTLGFYRLSSFGFQAGRTRRLALYAGAAVILCVTTLADGHSLAASLLYIGGTLTLLGFLLLRLQAPDMSQA